MLRSISCWELLQVPACARPEYNPETIRHAIFGFARGQPFSGHSLHAEVQVGAAPLPLLPFCQVLVALLYVAKFWAA